MAQLIGSFRSYLVEAREALTSLVFPASCRICARILDTGLRVPFCHSCIATLTNRLPNPVCATCGRPIVSLAVVENAAVPRCHLCRRGTYDFDLVRSFGPYTPSMARAVLMLKYAEVTPLGTWFAGLIAGMVQESPEEFACDLVVPVPLHPSRLRERGYNQAELIARPLSRRLGIPCRSYLLVRTRPRPEKLRLTRRERWETVREAYAMHKRAEVDKLRVLLVYDVFTTGATLDACSRALRAAGASRIVGLTVVRGMPSPAPDASFLSQAIWE